MQLKVLHNKFRHLFATCSPLRSPQKQSEKGFTAVEILVTTTMTSIFVSIAATSWQGLMEKQRLTHAQDAIYNAIQQTQVRATQTKTSQTIFFRMNSVGQAQYAILPGTLETANARTSENALWQNIEQGNAYQIVMGVTPETSIAGTGSRTGAITFDHNGNLQEDQVNLQVGLGVPTAGANSNPRSETVRCVSVVTLLGAMRKFNGTSHCNSNF